MLVSVFIGILIKLGLFMYLVWLVNMCLLIFDIMWMYLVLFCVGKLCVVL